LGVPNKYVRPLFYTVKFKTNGYNTQHLSVQINTGIVTCISDGRLLWDFLQQLLNDPTQRYTNYIAWKNRDTGVFKIVDPAGLAKLWGIQKNHLSMNYDKMSRALRYYYRVNILRKVQGERHCYQ
jgi:ETS translocation variant 6/7